MRVSICNTATDTARILEVISDEQFLRVEDVYTKQSVLLTLNENGSVEVSIRNFDPVPPFIVIDPGPQRATPSSVAQIEAEVKQVRAEETQVRTKALVYVARWLRARPGLKRFAEAMITASLCGMVPPDEVRGLLHFWVQSSLLRRGYAVRFGDGSWSEETYPTKEGAIGEDIYDNHMNGFHVSSEDDLFVVYTITEAGKELLMRQEDNDET